ncbi:DUF2442 domain-containing protein [bacterium]|nr:DUF2442 domain-containing protein [bacterium]MCI0604333.1 DUF2442 domain-containing protein [bacterium]
MSTLLNEIQLARAKSVSLSDDSLIVDLTDGRTISVPLAWYPRLVHGSPKERNHLEIIGNGQGIHWPDLDEDLSIEGLLLGKTSGESQRSLQNWLKKRNKQKRKK